MVEGQNDLTWERWLHIANLTERLGFASLFRSDHYFTGNRQLQSLEAWLSFAAIAREPHSYRFGALVTPITFRRPVNDARSAAQSSNRRHLTRADQIQMGNNNRHL
jgi:alkanesulfonate monooxygenase SsuD/methylene tetrahydromethanopterin reductase-like flavin-dependent oxidoreductase (luciferase family)